MISLRQTTIRVLLSMLLCMSVYMSAVWYPDFLMPPARDESMNTDEPQHPRSSKPCSPSQMYDVVPRRYQFSVSEEVKSWFGPDLSFPMTLYTDFTINPCSLCPADSQLDYLIVVHTATDHWDRRQAIRQTFGRRDIFARLQQRVVFLIGTTSDDDVTEKIQEEAEEYNDLVQGPFVDSYQNLTLKGVMGLKWVMQYCPRVNFVIKIDDDVFLNVFKVTKYLPLQYRKQHHRMGCESYPEGDKPIIRDDTNKWKVHASDFRGLDTYPFEHCNGFFVVMSGDMIMPMFQAAKVNPTFWIDDTYLYGMLPRTIGDVRFRHFWKYISRDVEYGEHCAKLKGVKCNILVILDNNYNRSRSDHIYRLWSLLVTNITDYDREVFHLSDSL